jgi:hypothetical protein
VAADPTVNENAEVTTNNAVSAKAKTEEILKLIKNRGKIQA